MSTNNPDDPNITAAFIGRMANVTKRLNTVVITRCWAIEQRVPGLGIAAAENAAGMAENVATSYENYATTLEQVKERNETEAVK